MAVKCSTPNSQTKAPEGDEQEFVEGVETKDFRALKWPGRNRAANDEQRKEKVKESAMHWVAKATKEMVATSKMKSQILANQSILALFPMVESICPLTREFVLLYKQEEIVRIQSRLVEVLPIPAPTPTVRSLLVSCGTPSHHQHSPQGTSSSPTHSPSRSPTLNLNILPSNPRMPMLGRNRLDSSSPSTGVGATTGL